MRILMVGINYAPEVTGIAPYTTGLAEGLADRGHEVHVLTGLPHYPEWKVADGWESSSRSVTTRHGVTVHRAPHRVPSVPSLRGRLRMEMSFGRGAVTARSPRPDVILAVTPSLIASAMVIARARASRLPIGLIVQDLYGLGVRETGSCGGVTARSVARFEIAVFRQASRIAVIHEHFRRTVTDMGIAPERVCVIRNWSHVEAAAVTTSDALATRRRFGWRDDEIVVLHTGNMGLKQGLHHVVDAAREAQARGLPVRFVLVGDGNQRTHLESAATGIDRLQMIRPLPDAEYRAILAAADLFLVNELPGVSEMAVPSKLTTYFAAGRAVVGAVDDGGVSAAEIRESGAGIIVAPGDPVALADAAYRLAADRDRCAAHAARGPAFAHGVLSPASAVDKYEQLCASLSVSAAKHSVPDTNRRVPGTSPAFRTARAGTGHRWGSEP